MRNLRHTSLFLGLALCAACDRGSGTALTSLTINGQPLDVAHHHLFAVDADSVGSGTLVEYTTENPRARVVLRVEDGTGVVLRERATRRLRLDAGQRLEVEVSDEADARIYAVSVPPVDLAPVMAEGDLGDGFYLLTTRDFTKTELRSGYSRYQLVVDGRGVPVWWRPSPGLTFDFRVTPHGDFSMNGQLGEGLSMESLVVRPEGAQLVERWSPPVPEVWTLATGDPHELWVFEDGSTLQSIRGERVEDLRSIGGALAHVVSATGLQARSPSGEITAEWTAFEHIAPELLPGEVVDQLDEERPFPAAHINSVDPLEDGWLLSLRSPGEVVRVDGQSGEVLWRLGGARSDFTFVDDPLDGFYGQHSARWLGSDQVALFDNRTNFDHHVGGDVRAVVYQLDFEAWTARLVFSHAAVGAGDADFAGQVQRLPNGETLVSWGSTQTLGDGSKAPILTRLGADGAVLGTLSLPLGTYSYRVWPAWGDPTVGAYRPLP